MSDGPPTTFIPPSVTTTTQRPRKARTRRSHYKDKGDIADLAKTEVQSEHPHQDYPKPPLQSTLIGKDETENTTPRQTEQRTKKTKVKKKATLTPTPATTSSNAEAQYDVLDTIIPFLWQPDPNALSVDSLMEEFEDFDLCGDLS